MRKFVLILGMVLSLCTKAQADICYDVNPQVARKAVDIIKTQKEIYQYCSICPDAEQHTLEVHDIKANNPIYVNGIALDLAHTYYKQDTKFINLGIATGCIKAEEYNIATELESFDSHIKEKNKLNDLKQKFEKCFTTFETEERKCPKSWSIKCYNYLIQANKNIQSCYKKIAIDLFNSYYNLSKSDAEKKFDTFQKFIYDQYIFIYTKSNYCEKNNCGVSIYLYSEYATTQELYHYVNRIIGSISARN